MADRAVEGADRVEQAGELLWTVAQRNERPYRRLHEAAELARYGHVSAQVGAGDFCSTRGMDDDRDGIRAGVVTGDHIAVADARVIRGDGSGPDLIRRHGGAGRIEPVVPARVAVRAGPLVDVRPVCRGWREALDVDAHDGPAIGRPNHHHVATEVAARASGEGMELALGDGGTGRADRAGEDGRVHQGAGHAEDRDPSSDPLAAWTSCTPSRLDDGLHRRALYRNAIYRAPLYREMEDPGQ